MRNENREGKKFSTEKFVKFTQKKLTLWFPVLRTRISFYGCPGCILRYLLGYPSEICCHRFTAFSAYLRKKIRRNRQERSGYVKYIPNKSDTRAHLRPCVTIRGEGRGEGGGGEWGKRKSVRRILLLAERSVWEKPLNRTRPKIVRVRRT